MAAGHEQRGLQSPDAAAWSAALFARAGPQRRFRPWVVTIVALAAVLILVVRTSASPSGTPGSSWRSFSYGFDFAQQGPYVPTGPDALAVIAARHVLSSIPGMLEDTSIMGWGVPNPEPSPGRFDLAGIASRIKLIKSTGGTPVVTLCTAPQWMTNSTSPIAAPTPAHYQDFAVLAARIAKSFPRVKYFVVWNEFKGFWSHQSENWDIRGYTTMYNDVYAAIKKVRPDALVGGPYAPTPPFARPRYGSLPSTLHGAWGYLYQGTLDAVRYWLANKVGADFIAVDGPDFPMTGPVTDPLTATEKFADTDRWLRRLTSLPIWWMESPVQPAGSGWSPGRAAAIRVAALVQLASSGARAGLQWQPQQGDNGVPDEGLWTSTEFPGGGQPTPLAQILPQVLAVLRYRVTVVPGQRSGVLVVTGPGGSIAINTNAVSSVALVNGTSVDLGPGQVQVRR